MEPHDKPINSIADDGKTAGWLPIDSAPMDGTPILVYFKGIGVKQVAWTEPVNSNWDIWCVDDEKHGPYALRGYIDGDDTHWMPLPPPPTNEGTK